ncbi:kinase-like protein [Atractiella rhizophila]|nr:kinase-like protein [Atractiella rhizophila]
MELTITRLGIDLSVLHAGEPVKVVPNRLLASERRRALRPTQWPIVRRVSLKECKGRSAHDPQDSFGKVCRVIERGTSNVRAVKHFKKSRLKSETTKGMFEKEMAILNEINHRNVVKLIECFDDDDDLCLVLEYVNGGTSSVMSQNAEIVHWDLKPGSILITHGINPVVKIADFGLAGMVQESELRTTWLAPEAIAKEFGLVIFSCMINAIPFDCENSEVPLATRLERRVLKWKDLPEGTSPECMTDLINTLLQRVDERMGVTEACQHPWILDDANLRVLKTVRLEPSFSEGRLLELLGPNPSYTATKSIQLIPEANRSPGDSSPHATEDQLLPEDSTMEASTIPNFTVYHFPVRTANPGPESSSSTENWIGFIGSNNLRLIYKNPSSLEKLPSNTNELCALESVSGNVDLFEKYLEHLFGFARG